MQIRLISVHSSETWNVKDSSNPKFLCKWTSDSKQIVDQKILHETWKDTACHKRFYSHLSQCICPISLHSGQWWWYQRSILPFTREKWTLSHFFSSSSQHRIIIVKSLIRFKLSMEMKAKQARSISIARFVKIVIPDIPLGVQWQLILLWSIRWLLFPWSITQWNSRFHVIRPKIKLIVGHVMLWIMFDLSGDQVSNRHLGHWTICETEEIEPEFV
jgi:hypothetical protein